MSATRRRQEGVVLLLVLFFALLLTSSVATFLSRTTVDSMIARNREHAARALAVEPTAGARHEATINAAWSETRAARLATSIS